MLSMVMLIMCMPNRRMMSTRTMHAIIMITMMLMNNMMSMVLYAMYTNMNMIMMSLRVMLTRLNVLGIMHIREMHMNMVNKSTRSVNMMRVTCINMPVV